MGRRTIRAVAITALAGLVVIGLPDRAEALPGEGLVGDFVGAGASAVFRETTISMVSWLLSGVGYFVEGALHFLQTATHPQVTAMWFSGPGSPYASVRSISVTLLLGFVLLGICSGLVHGDVAGMARRVAGGIPFAVVGMFVTTTVVDKLLTLTDALSAEVLHNAGSQSLTFMEGLTAASTMTGTGAFPTFLIAAAAVIAAFLLWIELIIRSAFVYFLVALTPLAFAATLWPAARGVLRKLMELLIAAIFSKLIICIALSIGSAALVGVAESAPADSDVGVGTATAMGTGTLLAGAVLLIIAAYAPFLLLRMIPLVEGAVVANGVSRGPLRAAQTGMNTTSSVSSMARLAGSTTNATAAAPTSAAARATRIAGPGSSGSTSTRATAGAKPQQATPAQPKPRPSSTAGPAADYMPSGPPPGSRPIPNSPDVTSSTVDRPSTEGASR